MPLVEDGVDEVGVVRHLLLQVARPSLGDPRQHSNPKYSFNSFLGWRSPWVTLLSLHFTLVLWFRRGSLKLQSSSNFFHKFPQGWGSPVVFLVGVTQVLSRLELSPQSSAGLAAVNPARFVEKSSCGFEGPLLIFSLKFFLFPSETGQNFLSCPRLSREGRSWFLF